MRRSSLLALATACVAVTAAAPPRSAQTGDSVTGRIQVRTSASTVLDVSFDAHSGPSGEQPSGTVTDNGSGNVGFVQCLNVVGNQAVLIATGNNFIILISVEDNDGGSQDRFGFDSLFGGPLTCPDPGTFGLDPITSGNIVVTDVPFPTSREQCKKGGWRNFPGFKNQGACVSFVATGGGNRPGEM